MRSEELEGIREYLKAAFNELGETLPLYHASYSYVLLPDALSLNEIIDVYNAVQKDALCLCRAPGAFLGKSSKRFGE